MGALRPGLWGLAGLLGLTLAACASTSAGDVGPATPAQAQPRAQPQRPRGHAGAVSALHAAPLGGLAGLYRLTFVHTAVSSCSRTFDVSTTRGQLALDLRRAARAALTVERAVESNGSDRRSGKRYRHVGRAERCRWRGSARRAPTGLAVELERVEPADFICSWDGTTSSKKTPRRFTLTCRPRERPVERVRPRGAPPPSAAPGVPLLSCALRPPVPRALEEATLDGALPLSRRHRLRLIRSDGDMTIEDSRSLQIVDDAPAPKP